MSDWKCEVKHAQEVLDATHPEIPGGTGKTNAALLKRIAELEAELHYATNAGVIECMVRNKAVAEHIAELEARLAQVEGDAGRYQWLRKGSPKSNRLPHITQYPYQAKIDENRIPQVWDIEGYHPDRLDAAIDAAMKEQK